MRTARAGDHWNLLYKRNYNTNIISINLNGLNSINKINFNNGIFAICGLNGAGKSTIITALKDILGVAKTNQETKQDSNKLQGRNVEAELKIADVEIVCTNNDGERFVDKISANSVYYIDYKKSTDAMDFFINQENLEELLEQNEPCKLTSQELKELGYIIGRKYNACIIIEIEDVEDLGTIPYFEVDSNCIKYNSLSMGIGEHFLFYIYWIFYHIDKNSVILIEEPETFISILSQETLMNHIAYKASEMGHTIVIATHSPFIIKHVRRENIIIISRYGLDVSINTPEIEQSAFKTLGLDQPCQGTFFVEDFAAKLFLRTILSENHSWLLTNYQIDFVGSESEITKRLQFPNSEAIKYKFIGVYDGDQRDKIDDHKLKIKWPFCFLPTQKSVEEEFKEVASIKIDVFSKKVGQSRDKIVQIFSELDGKDEHDWLLDLSKELGKDIQVVFSLLYDLWKEDNDENVQGFVESLTGACYT